MELIKIRSPKHEGAIFLKVKKTEDDFICKIYARNNANDIADTIIRALKEHKQEQEHKSERVQNAKF